MARSTPPPATDRRNLFVRMEADEHARLQAAADADGRSISSYVRRLIADHLEKDGKR